MNLRAKITARHQNSYILLDGVQTFKKESTLRPSLKLKSYLRTVNILTPVEIIDTRWNKLNDPDEIIYKSASGVKYLIIHENLLADITEYMKQNHMKGTLPYLHIDDKDGYECHRRPAKHHILEFLRVNLSNYDIYSVNGDLVREANNERRKFTLCVDLD